MILYLGDIHGNFNLVNQYIKTYGLKDCYIIQVGDFGVGFQHFEKENRMIGDLNKILQKNNIKLYAIRGNHDYKPYFDNDPFGYDFVKLIPDYTVLNLEDKNILCIGGAVSVDRMWRYTKKQRCGIYEDTKVGVESWWPDEVFILDIDKLKDLRDINVMVTHTCPEYCPPDNTFGFGPFVEGIIRETGDNALKGDLMFERKQMTDAFEIVKLNNNITNHYYGHFHRSDTFNKDYTKHRLLNIGELWEEKY